jgi:NADH-quinone oxidoreductase subunit N
MYFDKPVEGTQVRLQPDFTLRVALSLNALVLLALGLWWGPLLGWCKQAFVG